MGKVSHKSKASSLERAKRTAAKTAIKHAKLAAREANLPPGTTPKLRHKDIKKAKVAASQGIKYEDLVITTAPQRAKEALSHVKWTALFKKHLGVLESHVKALDRVAQHLKSYMSGLPDEERARWEKGEEGNWGKICGLLDRARDTLCNAREASQGLVAPQYLRDKKGLGVTGINYVPLLPQVEALKAGLTVDKEDNGATALGATTKKAEPVDNDGDSEMEDAPEADSDSDSSSSDSDSSDSDDEDSAPKKKIEEKPTKPVADIEPNPYFVVDTEPTPVNLPTTSTILPAKKGKKRTKDEETTEKKVKKVKKSQVIELAPETKEIKRKEKSEDDEEPKKKSKKAKIEKEVTVVEEDKEVDFHALQAQLQAEVDVGEATKEVEALGESKEAKKERKRRRSSDGLSKEGKKHKKEKSESRKRKAEDEEEGGKKRKA